MKTGFRKSFAKDLKKIKDKSLLIKFKTVIETVEAADKLSAIINLKKPKQMVITTVSALAIIG